MSFQITTAFVEQFKNEVMHLPQQMESRFAGKVRRESQKGKTGYYEQLGSTVAVKRTTRHGATPRVDSVHARRACFLTDYDWSDIVDSLDDTKMLINPTSYYVQSAQYAFERAKDLEIIASATGTAYSGENGTTTSTIPAGNVIAVNYVASGSATNSGLTLAKLIQAKHILGTTEYMKGAKLCFAVRQQQITDLLQNVNQVSSADYSAVKALQMGEVTDFMGFEFIKTELLDVDTATDYATCFAYVDYALLLAVGQDSKARITEESTLNYATQVYMNMAIGATRLIDNLVVKVTCDQSV